MSAAAERFECGICWSVRINPNACFFSSSTPSSGFDNATTSYPSRRKVSDNAINTICSSSMINTRLRSSLVSPMAHGSALNRTVA